MSETNVKNEISVTEKAKKEILRIMQENNVPEVSETKYDSLKSLNSIMKLVDIVSFNKIAVQSGLKEIKNYEYDLATGKKFYVGYYKKIPR